MQRARELCTDATKQESHLWYDYLSKYPVRFFRQFVIGEYITDFCCRKAKVVVELDGRHHEKQSQKVYDKERDAYLQARGFQVLRFANAEVDARFQGARAAARFLANKIYHKKEPSHATQQHIPRHRPHRLDQRRHAGSGRRKHL